MKKKSKSMSSPITRDQIRRLQRENERLTQELGVAKMAAWYLFDVISAHKLDKFVAAAVKQWPFLPETERPD